MKQTVIVISFLLITFIANAQTNPFEKRLPLIDRYIDSLMKEWNIPGLALGIVYKDNLVYAKGYGYRDLERKLPVSHSTLFPIASNTKLFTAIALCMLAGEGKLSLDMPVRNFLPSLHFSTDELNAKVTLRDMLSHRTGLPSSDNIWAVSNAGLKELIPKIAHIKPSLGFRQGFLYNNGMYIASAAVMESVTSSKWEDIVKARLLDPLEMRKTSFSYDDMMKSDDFAYGYLEPDSVGVIKKVPFRTLLSAAGPAGGIRSNIDEMSHWMIALLNDGKYKGRQIIPAAIIRETRLPNSIVEQETKWNELSNPLYGLGMWMLNYKGYKIAQHTGGIMDGYFSNLTLIPSENLGVFMVHNSIQASTLRPIMTFFVIDRLLNLSYTPWSERYMKEYVDNKKMISRRTDSINATQVKNTVPSHALKDYTGIYTSSIFSDFTIELENDELVYTFQEFKSALKHFHYDQFVSKDLFPWRLGRINFLTNSKGEIDRFTFGETEFVKTKKQ